MNLMKQNHEESQSDLLKMKQFMQNNSPNESLPRDINDTSNEQVSVKSLKFLMILKSYKRIVNKFLHTYRIPNIIVVNKKY